jgi:hypothetical protein
VTVKKCEKMKNGESADLFEIGGFENAAACSVLRIDKTSRMADAKAAAQQRKDSEKEGGKKAQDIAGE